MAGRLLKPHLSSAHVRNSSPLSSPHPTPCPADGTVWHAAITRGQLQPGETLLVTGASGGVGSAAVRLAAAMGCRVLAITSTPDKVAYLQQLGAHEVGSSAVLCDMFCCLVCFYIQYTVCILYILCPSYCMSIALHVLLRSGDRVS